MTLVCLSRLERPLYALSTHSLCHWGTGTLFGQGRARAGAHAIDQIALCSQAAMIKRVPAWHMRFTAELFAGEMVNRVGIEPTLTRFKRPPLCHSAIGPWRTRAV